MPGDQFAEQFGANEWLVEEMYERFLLDPASVDPKWHALFADIKENGATHSPTPIAGAPRGGTPPIPKSSQPVTPAPIVTTAPIVTSARGVVQPAAPRSTTPADPVVKPAPVLANPDAGKVEALRGVSGRVVQSMEASLSVPTATSVRAIAAKLLIDNRIVINNHLQRARGGKVSFTHLIAFAMIKALRAMPEMNSYFTQLDGKPAVGHPDHINLGIAIDIAKADGSRQLLVPSIKGCEELDFAQFWASYLSLIHI